MRGRDLAISVRYPKNIAQNLCVANELILEAASKISVAFGATALAHDQLPAQRSGKQMLNREIAFTAAEYAWHCFSTQCAISLLL